MIKLSRLWRQRQIHVATNNLVNSLDPEPLKRFEPELTQILATLGRRTGYVFNIMGSKVKVTPRNFGQLSISNRPCFYVGV